VPGKQAAVDLCRHEVCRARDLRRLAPGGGRQVARDDYFTGLREHELHGIHDQSEIKGQIRDSMDKMGISPDAIARAIVFAIEQPADVDVGEIIVRPTAQS
jgi:hypothetical protein